jgi:hypothetical protein
MYLPLTGDVCKRTPSALSCHPYLIIATSMPHFYNILS